jgi:hypothetical protein
MASKKESFSFKGALFIALVVVVALLYFFDFSTGGDALSIKWSSRGSKASAGALQIFNHIKEKFSEQENSGPAPSAPTPRAAPRVSPTSAPSSAPPQAVPAPATPQPAPIANPEEISEDDRQQLDDFFEQHAE